MDYKLWFHITLSLWIVIVFILVFGIHKKVWDYYHKDGIEYRKRIAKLIINAKADDKKKKELLLKFT